MATIVAHYSGESGIFKGLDVAKFIIALLVMEAHLQATGVLPEAFRETFIAPLLAIPVPLFFVFSSFFLFKKLHISARPWQQMGQFLKRIGVLYGFWIVAWSPYLLVKKTHYFQSLDGLGSFACDFFFGEVFGNSWFFGALIVGMVVVFLLSRCLSDKVWWLLPVGVFVYLALAPLLPESAKVPIDWYSSHLYNPYCSAPYNLI